MSERIKAAALSATKGLSRVQAERAAANATRNVNAYGQKEEGPSRWQERKEAKTQMYLKSTEKQVTVNEKRCQKCRQTGHWTYECQKQPPDNPKLEIRLPFSYDLDALDIKEERAEKDLKKKKKKKVKSNKRENKKRKHRSRSPSESSDSESDREDHGSQRKRKRHGRRSSRGR